MIYEGIKILQNRGYDSCGICSLTKDQEILVHKYASRTNQSSIDLIGEKLVEHQDSIPLYTIHCRWATNGSISDLNSHPHLDNKHRVSVVHNGIIENYQELKNYLLSKNYQFVSETDTEIIANLIGFYLDTGYNIHEAIEFTTTQLEGTWGLAIIYKNEPDRLFICRNGSPLLVGYDSTFAIVASESSAILNHVKTYFVLKDKSILTIHLDRSKGQIKFTGIDYLENLVKIDSDTESHGHDLVVTTPEPYEHWMLKEIMEQPKSIMRTLNMGGRIENNFEVKLGGLNANIDDLLKIRNLIILACGTSFHAGLLGAKYFKRLQCFNSVQVIDASEFTLIDLPLPIDQTGLLVLSQSGETKDIHRAMELAKDQNIFIFSIVNVVGSLIAREADCGVYLNAGREVAVASTKSFTSQVVALSLIAIWFSQKRENNKLIRQSFIQGLRNLSLQTEETLKHVHEWKNLIPIFKKHSSLFILGRDFGEAIAYEGALKIKEIAYLHAEGYSGGSLKHGPFALITKGLPIIIIMLDDDQAKKMEIAGIEVKSRGATTVLITNCPNNMINFEIWDHIIRLPQTKLFGHLLTIFPLQYLAYCLALEFNHNPDYPRNLAKVVTVDG